MYQKVGEFEILSNHGTKNSKHMIQNNGISNMKEL